MAKKSGGDESKNKITVGVVSKNNPFSSRRFVVFVIVVLVVLVAAAVVVFSLTHNKAEPIATRPITNAQDGLGGTVMTPTKEQIREASDVKRVDGVVTSVSAKTIVLALKNGNELALNIDNKTTYNSGGMMYPAKSGDVKADQKAVVTYDSEGNKLKSIWVNYDE